MMPDEEKTKPEWPPEPKLEIVKESFAREDSKNESAKKPSGEKKNRQ